MAASASRRLRDLQSQPGNKTCVDCPQRNPQWASVSHGVFLCLECSGKHRGLGVHISFVRSVTMDSWSEIQLKKMESGGNDPLNAFLSLRGVPKETLAAGKYNTRAAAAYRDRIQALADGRPWDDPPVVRESVTSVSSSGRPPLAQSNGGWDSWGDESRSSASASAPSDVRRNHSVGDFRAGGRGGVGVIPARSRSVEDLQAQLDASDGNKESFFARKIAENGARPEGIPPSQGGKYVGFGSSPPLTHRSNSQGDMLSAVSQGLGRLSCVAASAAQSAANVVQAGTKELTSKVIEGGYEYKVNETVNVVASKTTEIGQKTWGIMKGVVAIASQKVDEFADWQRDESERNGYYHEFRQEKSKAADLTSWDDWGEHPAKERTQSGESWAVWENMEDDGAAAAVQGTSHGSQWRDGGFL